MKNEDDGSYFIWLLPLIIISPLIILQLGDAFMNNDLTIAIITVGGVIVAAIIGAIVNCWTAAKKTDKRLDETKSDLSKDHKDILHLSENIAKDLSSAKSDIRDINERQKIDLERRRLLESSFSEKQLDTKKKVEEISDFLKDWENKTLLVKELYKTNQTLRNNIEDLRLQNKALSEDIYKLKNEFSSTNETDNYILKDRLKKAQPSPDFQIDSQHPSEKEDELEI